MASYKVGQGVVITTIKPTRDGKDLLVHLFNAADQTVNAKLKWTHHPKATWISNPMEKNWKAAMGLLQWLNMRL